MRSSASAPLPGPSHEPVVVSELLSSLAAGMHSVQEALDERGLASVRRWETDGLPPSAWMVAGFRVSVPASFDTVPRDGSECRGLRVTPGPSRARLALAVRFVPGSLDAVPPEDPA
jgi:hypothetical protein